MLDGQTLNNEYRMLVQDILEGENFEHQHEVGKIILKLIIRNQVVLM
jgi:hypothetical protein